MTAYILWDISPTLFQNLHFLRWYGICWALGLLAAYELMRRIYKIEKRSEKELEKLSTYLIIGAIVGARLGHVFFYDPAYYLQHPIEILPFKIDPAFEFTGLAGLASHGGVAGVLIALFLFVKKYKVDYLLLLDRLVIAGVLLGSFIRLGNLMNSEIIGTPTNAAWAFIFTHVDQVPRHPAQLYEAIFYLIATFLLYRVWSNTDAKQNTGLIFGLGLVLVFVQRFLVEFVKENQVAFEESLLLNMGQLLSIPLILVGATIIVWSRRKRST